MRHLRIIRDTNGGPLVEMTIMIPICFVFVLGSIDFLFVFYQWNMAAKAAAVGARIAAVSNPIATGLNSSSNSGVPGGVLPSYSVVCDGSTQSCSGCTVVCNGYSSAAMNTIVFGRGSASCGDATSYNTAGMCDFFDRITVANVTITYTQTGLGFAGRPDGLVPTITVQLQNIPFQFFFLGGLLGFSNVTIPPVTTTMSAEDLCSSNSC